MADRSPALAIRLYARAALARETTPRWLHYELGWRDPTPNLSDLRSQVGEETSEEECARGRSMTVLEAVLPAGLFVVRHVGRTSSHRCERLPPGADA